jgi:hypothetical protein
MILVWLELIAAPSSLASERVLRLILQVDATGLSINNKTPKEWLIQPSLLSSINLPTTQLTHPLRIDASLFSSSSSSSFSSPLH